MKEYEYSFMVESIDPYTNYCESNNYTLEKSNYQIRELFKNTNKILARITTEITKNEESYILDFKDDNDTELLVKEARETVPLKFNKENRNSIDSMLQILDFRKEKILKRKRKTYEKDKVVFEIDEYLEPEICYVVAIEGEKQAVDKVYQELTLMDDKIC